MEIINKSINEIIPYENNPRKNAKAVDPVAASIKEFGFLQPIVLDKDNVIIVGHTRFKAAQKLKMEEVPVIYAEGLTEVQIKAYRLVDNKTNELATWDNIKLDIERVKLEEFKFDLTPFGFVNTNILLDDEFDIDGALAAPEFCSVGGIYQLGSSRLICGDCTDGAVIEKLMGGKQADMVLTDPPYNVDYEGATKEKLKRQNDKMKDSIFLEFLSKAFISMHRVSRAGASIYVFHADSEGYNFRTAFKDAGYQLRQCLVWVKNTPVMGRQDYQWKHEPILYGWKEGGPHSWYSDRKQRTLVNFDKPQKSEEHPTMKPIGLCGYFINNSSKAGDIILDTFGGSGSTLMAAEQLGRSCYMAELSPKYCGVIVRRFEVLTGQTAVKLNGG